jgi:aspartyl-tRNA(Asn)/glutamyl-tRNA(Gln) amidotransferase subunit C
VKNIFSSQYVKNSLKILNKASLIILVGDKREYWKIDRKIVKHVADIARLKLTEEEIEKFTKQLKDILDAFRAIDEVDTSSVKPSFHPQEIKNVLREDEVVKWEWDPLGNTKLKEKRYFKGPRII